MMTVFDILEKKEESGKASKDGNTKDKGKVSSQKSRARTFDTIDHALKKGYIGQIFTTTGSDRLYVISKAGWGEKSSGRIAKGFTPGSATPSAKFKSIKAHAARTMLKHGTSKSKRLKKLYGPGANDKIDNSKKAVGRGKK